MEPTSSGSLKRYSEALAVFALSLAEDNGSVQLLSGFVETAMKSPLRASLEPIYRQLQQMDMNLDKSPFVITSVVGQELLAAGHYAAAVVVLESALKIGSCSLKLRGSVFSALSSAYWALNNLDKAISYMQHDLQVSNSLGDSLGECRAHGNLGSAYFAKCNYKEALVSHRYQLVLAMKCKHTLQAALALTSLGHVYSAIGDINNALASHKQCLKLVRQIGDPLAEAREIGNVGAVYLASGDFEKALECHLEHVKLAKLLGNKAEEARAYSNLGSAHHYRRNFEQAIHFHEQVLRISQEIGERTIEAKAYAGLGHAARSMGDLLQAKRWHERQLDIGLATKDRLVEGNACSNLSIIYKLLAKRLCPKSSDQSLCSSDQSLCSSDQSLCPPIKCRKGEGFLLELYVKSYRPDELTLKVVGNLLLVIGKHKEKENSYGYISRQFTRRYQLPENIDLSQISSKLSIDGKLTIKAPLLQKNETKELVIPITIIDKQTEDNTEDNNEDNTEDNAEDNNEDNTEDNTEDNEKNEVKVKPPELMKKFVTAA